MMAYINLGKFKICNASQHESFTILHFNNEAGKDFYELCNEVPTDNVAFLAVDSNGVVSGASTDLSTFNPDNFTMLQSDDASEASYSPDGHPLKKWTWDGVTINKSTYSDDDVLAYDVRLQRDGLLRTYVDPIVSNPLRWADMTAEQQAAWASYRAALLDITLQDDFPHNVIWPTKP